MGTHLTVFQSLFQPISAINTPLKQTSKSEVGAAVIYGTHSSSTDSFYLSLPISELQASIRSVPIGPAPKGLVPTPSNFHLPYIIPSLSQTLLAFKDFLDLPHMRSCALNKEVSDCLIINPEGNWTEPDIPG